MTPSAVTIGNFDGVHAGHRQIMHRLIAIAKHNGWRSVVLTFDPHPSKVVAPDRAPRLITTPQERAELLHALGIDLVEILPFTKEVSMLTPEEFVKQVLVDRLCARAVLVGHDFRFGHKASGLADTLRDLGQKYGFYVEIVEPVKCRNRVVSSTEIRRLVESGDVSTAGRLLDRPFTLEGEVVKGHGVGSKQTVPTLNLKTSAELLPKVGVYITRTTDRNTPRSWESITNVGYRPTFGGTSLTIETFLLSRLEGDPPVEIRVEFLRRIRDEQKFESPEALKLQIMKDVSRAQAYFRRRKLPLYSRLLSTG
jgi:riboflavin kinase/FMN adenylyltransferase